MLPMKLKFRIFRRASGIFFIEDREAGKQESLRTRDEAVAKKILHARNESHQQPILNLQIARAYLLASDPTAASRTWTFVMAELAKTKRGSTLCQRRNESGGILAV